MNYEPNPNHWQPGAIVIHDADAKRPHMLMRVVGYDREGLCITEYIDPEMQRGALRSQWHNPITVLHAPERFGLHPLAPVPHGAEGGAHHE